VLGRLVTLPIRLTVDLLKLPIEGTKLALALVRELVEQEPAPAPARPQEPAVRPAPPPPPAPDVFEPEPVEPTHVSEEPELVAESADPEAADAGTAEVHVAEPWEGYRRMKADEVIARIADATAEELAVIELYEQTHRARKSVLAAVMKQLRVLANRP
jgi:hypothetical protein